MAGNHKGVVDNPELVADMLVVHKQVEVTVAGNREEEVGNFGVVADMLVVHKQVEVTVAGNREEEAFDKLLGVEQLVDKPHQHPKLEGELVEGKDKGVAPEGVAQAFDCRVAKLRHQFSEPAYFYPANGLFLNVWIACYSSPSALCRSSYQNRLLKPKG